MNQPRYYRQKALASLSGNWGTAIIICIITGMLINSTADLTVLEDLKVISILPEMLQQFYYGALGLINRHMSTLTFISATSSFVAFVFGGMIQMGECRYFLNLGHGNNPQFSDLFSYFKYLFKGIIYQILHNIYIGIWVIPFTIIGIIAIVCGAVLIGSLIIFLAAVPCLMAAYAYHLAPYLLAENPELSAGDALRRSKVLMSGKKMDLFTLQLSFIGWNLLTIITFGFAGFWVTPYFKTATALFSADILNNHFEPLNQNTEFYQEGF